MHHHILLYYHCQQTLAKARKKEQLHRTVCILKLKVSVFDVYVPVYLDVHQCVPVYLDVYQCVPVYLDVHQCVPVYLDVHQSVPMYLDEYQCVPMYLDVHQCVPVSGSKPVCTHVSADSILCIVRAITAVDIGIVVFQQSSHSDMLLTPSISLLMYLVSKSRVDI